MARPNKALAWDAAQRIKAGRPVILVRRELSGAWTWQAWRDTAHFIGKWETIDIKALFEYLNARAPIDEAELAGALEEAGHRTISNPAAVAVVGS